MNNFVDSSEASGFGIPVALIFFKRIEKTIQILDRIAQVRPKKLYLISDGARNDEERELVEECRRQVDARIDWECEVIRDYAVENAGVYDRIGLGALRILSRESSAIFLEDDNLPELSFFAFCEEMLNKYRDVEDVLWVCGTNYLYEYEPPDESDYVFTRHMLPCGWASWGHKFPKYYDGDMLLLKNPAIYKKLEDWAAAGALNRQIWRGWMSELHRIETGKRPNSWDYQMSLTLVAHGLLGIVPRFNQIRNIGVDIHSTHGGTSMSNVMTRRFCEVDTRKLVFPLNHPRHISIDPKFEALTSGIILFPFFYRVKGAVNRLAKRVLFIDEQDSLIATLRKRFSLRGNS